MASLVVLPGQVIAELVVLVGLLGMSAFFSISETSFIGVQRMEVRRKAAEGARALDWRMLDLTIMPVESLNPLPPKNAPE